MPLHPDAVQFLKNLEEADPPAWSELPPAESREIFEGFGEVFGEGPQDVESRDFATASGVQVRSFRPDSTASSAVVFFHGGGWVLGSTQTHDTLCRNLAKHSGRVVFSVDYRRAPEAPYPAAFDDSFAAYSDVLAAAGDHGIDPHCVAVAGDSAGGNLAAAVCLAARDRKVPMPECQVLIYPVIDQDFETESYKTFADGFGLTRDTMRWFWQQYVGDRTAGELPYASLLGQDLNGLPPALVQLAEYDVLFSEGKAFAKRLADAGCDVALKDYEGVLHGFVHFSGVFEVGHEAIRDMADFLSRQRRD